MLTQQILKQYLHYDTETGIFTWINKTSKFANIKVGNIAGCLHCRGYIIIRFNCKYYKAHHLAWLYIYGKFPNGEIDHINHIRNDNRIINLRCISRLENMHNQSMYKTNKSGFTGVTWHKRDKKWVAHIRINNKRIHLGNFVNIDDAILARKKANDRYNFHYNHGKNID